MDWKPIAEEPGEPCEVLFHSANRRCFYWVSGDIVPEEDMLPGERYDVGYWTGEEWRYAGTNHDVFEFEEEREQGPTHYAKIEPPNA